jgi:hypothetical protein
MVAPGASDPVAVPSHTSDRPNSFVISSPSPAVRLLRCALVALVALLALPNVAAAAPDWSSPMRAAARPKDPVLTAIAAAVKVKALTPADAVKLRAVWSTSARAERTARTGARRSNIRAVRAYATNLARHRALTPTRLKPVFLSIDATTKILGSRRAMPRHEQVVRVPGELAVFKYYSGRGVQFQPFETFKLGVGYLTQDPPRTGAARKLADRMLELGTVNRTATSWEFHFPFGGPASPWRSAIAQAHALRMYALLAQQVPEAERPKYTAAADAIVQSFNQGTAGGGVAVNEGPGKFYVMYSFNPAQRILNGHLQSLLSLWRYSQQTGSPAARAAYDRGYAALVPIISKFDTGDWSRYQYNQEADREYHSFMTEQLQDLARETRDPMFVLYARRFRIYLEEPASLGIRVPTPLPSIVLPKDGYRDTIALRFELNKNARVTAIITDGNGMEVRRITAAAARGINTIYWDGKDAMGAQAPDDAYLARFSVIDRFGRRSAANVTQPLVIEHDTEPPLPILATLIESADGTSTQVTINVQETASRWYEGQLFIAGAAITDVVHVKSGPITFTVPRPRAEVLTASVHFVDSSGNTSDTPLASVLSPTTESG